MSLLQEVKNKLEKALPGAGVEVYNESSRHMGHNAGGAHLGVKVTYSGFKGKTLIEQHKIIYDLLKEEMKTKIHALVVKTKVN